MNYPIPPNSSDGDGLCKSVDENALVDALKIVVISARANGQTLEDVKAEILADDQLLDVSQRTLLSDVVAKAWEEIPSEKPELATVTPISSETRRKAPLLAG
ncbi:hypothetical protein IQ266_20725 [filamentous cyanobacterium LEGE 11480]|uniref:Uncharacterized protein n=1 Tax=Romeriopsis navalis LEGE 11480 TaxID=2777977 RepID=A0A928VTA9_9CYAN|nr:hypothetical protein [Romeriopsis navalis]MBE9032167.1 hypothetical protein [Romeriopsis navalis LEGE 11480]